MAVQTPGAGALFYYYRQIEKQQGHANNANDRKRSQKSKNTHGRGCLVTVAVTISGHGAQQCWSTNPTTTNSMFETEEL